MKVGDTVRVKHYDELVDEFGIDEDIDEIKCGDENFVEQMKELCGEYAVISDIGNYILLDGTCSIDKHSDKQLDWGWAFSSEMLRVIK